MFKRIKRKGFTLLEVLIALTIFAFGILIVLNLLIVNGKVILENKYRIQAQNLLLTTLYDCANAPDMPYIVEGEHVIWEIHSSSVNNQLKTFFGPISTSTVVIEYWENNNWLIYNDFIAQPSGAILLNNSFPITRLSYDVLGWDYIREKRRNFMGENLYLSYTDMDIQYMVTDGGEDVNLNLSTIIDSSRAIIQVNAYDLEWITFYYKKPKDFVCSIYRPNINNFTLTDNIVHFETPNLQGWWVKIIYQYEDSIGNMITKTELLLVDINNEVSLAHMIAPNQILECRSLTLEGKVSWDIYGSEVEHKEIYKIIGI